MEQKRKTTDYHEVDFQYETLRSLQEKIADLIERYGDAASYDIDIDYDCGSTSGYITQKIAVSRIETDDEFAARMESAELLKTARKATYEKLKKEFEV